MPIQRIPLVEPITTRDGQLPSDAELVNVIVETVEENIPKRVVITRPALDFLVEIIPPV